MSMPTLKAFISTCYNGVTGTITLHIMIFFTVILASQMFTFTHAAYLGICCIADAYDYAQCSKAKRESYA